jgi:hypothetical protein
MEKQRGKRRRAVRGPMQEEPASRRNQQTVIVSEKTSQSL